MRFTALFLVIVLALAALSAGKFDARRLAGVSRAECDEDDLDDALECALDLVDCGTDCDCLGDYLKCVPNCTVEDYEAGDCDEDDEEACEDVYGDGCKHCKCGSASTVYVTMGAIVAAVAVALF